ncbi:MAG TPA: RNA polymerase sigma factor, partial [Pseudonocardiaceae bacterium]
MVSVAAHPVRRRGTRAPEKTQEAQVKDVECDPGEPSSMPIEPSNDSVPLALEDTEDPQEPVDSIESAELVWDEEESEALRQARKDAELTASADSVREYLKQIGKIALLNA